MDRNQLLDLLASGPVIAAVKSEDGFTVLPDRPFGSLDREEFDCLILPGMWEPLPVLLDERNIRFLEQF